MPELLIVRSVSFQQLDLNLPEIIKKFPEHNINLLTHTHGVSSAEKYTGLTQIFVYEHEKNFHFMRKPGALSGKSFDVLILPVSNITGTGFENVLAFGFSIRAKERYICNLISEFKKITGSQLALGGLASCLFAVLSLFLTVLVSLFIGLYMLIRLILGGFKRMIGDSLRPPQ